VFQKKRLQVFISSTFTDLQAERQAAVEAILTAGHIPAGMELFTAGDQSQMAVIKRWIDESDVYMLILGARYGSVEATTGKSYTQLEYEYAVEKGKPLFAVAIDSQHIDKWVKKHGRKVDETERPQELKKFRELACSKMVRFWTDHKDIKLSVHETLSEFGRREDLIGWIPGDQAVNAGKLAEEIARLTRENSDLRERLSTGLSVERYAGATCEEMCLLLKSVPVNPENFNAQERGMLAKAHMEIDQSGDINLLDFFLAFHVPFMAGLVFTSNDPSRKHLASLTIRGLLSLHGESGNAPQYYRMTADGLRFLTRLSIENLAKGTASGR
jgi:hypothetical protein